MSDLSRCTIHLVGHAHIDLGYRWRWNETVHRIARDTFRGILRLMERVPEVIYVQSQLALYEAMAAAGGISSITSYVQLRARRATQCHANGSQG